jgi:aminoglycoside 6'-N-acetyltransferase I
MAIEIRRATTDDQAVVAALITRFLAEEGFGTDPDLVARRTPVFLTTAGNMVLLAASDGDVVGVATITTRFGFEVGRYAEIEDLYVVPEHRAGRVGSLLVDAALDACRDDGCEHVEVVVTPEGEAAHGLVGWYARFGLVDRGRRLLDRDL